MPVDHEEAAYQRQTPPGSLFESFGDQVRRRVEDVLEGRDCLYPLSVVQSQFLRLVLYNVGERRAVARATWTQQLRIQDRVLREVVQSLRQDFGVAIGTARDGGYFLIETREEFDEALRGLTLHAVTTLRVAKGMSRGNYDELLHQVRLQLTEAR